MKMMRWKVPMLRPVYGVRRLHSLIDVSKAVQRALASNKPVVALESTIITHGMPYPHNETTAIAVEELVKQHGVVPATVGVINGRIKVGMDRDMISVLARPDPKTVKISRRDFPFVISQGFSGGTTVSGTLLVAKMVGIDVFVTGGIGGVHRDVNDSLDVSADLIELSRSPVLVVCSGVKSILDIGRTLEYLETFGVCVVTYGETKEFPAFYTRRSGYQSVYNMSNPEAVADLIFHSKKLNSDTGIVLGVPIPEEFSFDDEIMRAAIDEALRLAKERGVYGKSLTPFILEQINHITEGKSLDSNIALIKNNAVVGSQIAVQLSERKQVRSRMFEKDGFGNFQREDASNKSKEHPNIVVIGGAVMDIVVRAYEDFEYDGRTLNGAISSSAGGVARNMADAIGKLQTDRAPYFISTLGDDIIGQFLWNSLDHVNRDGVSVVGNANSACSVVLLDQQRDCSLIIMNMDTHRLIRPEQVSKHEDVIAESSLVVFDGNLPVDTMSKVLQLCEKHNIAVWFEPTDLTVASKPFQTETRNAVDYISPNFRELQRMVQFIRKTPVKPIGANENVNVVVKEARDLALEILPLVPNIMVTLGKHGLLMVRYDCSRPRVVFYPAEQQHSIENVSGVGDCLASGYIVAMLRGLTEPECVSVGMSVALQSLGAEQTVPSTLGYPWRRPQQQQPSNEMSKFIELPVTGTINV